MWGENGGNSAWDDCAVPNLKRAKLSHLDRRISEKCERRPDFGKPIFWGKKTLFRPVIRTEPGISARTIRNVGSEAGGSPKKTVAYSMGWNSPEWLSKLEELSSGLGGGGNWKRPFALVGHWGAFWSASVQCPTGRIRCLAENRKIKKRSALSVKKNNLRWVHYFIICMVVAFQVDKKMNVM